MLRVCAAARRTWEKNKKLLSLWFKGDQGCCAQIEAVTRNQVYVDWSRLSALALGRMGQVVVIENVWKSVQLARVHSY